MPVDTFNDETFPVQEQDTFFDLDTAEPGFLRDHFGKIAVLIPNLSEQCIEIWLFRTPQKRIFDPEIGIDFTIKRELLL